MTQTQQPSTKQDILRMLLKQGEVSASDLAQQLQVSAQGIRRHLKDLEAEALIQHRVVHGGAGRPNHLYGLSEKGRSQLPDKSDQFAISLLDSLAGQVSAEQMDLILRLQWERKAIEYRDRIGKGSLRERVQALVTLRLEEGYMAESHEVAESSSKYVLTEYNCAISHIAQTFPNVCGHELEMFTIALSDCQVERTHWLVDGEHRCGYLIQGKSE
jgi:DeoR family transcriptional regulator, suf operon transcriptional repressor